MNWNALAVHIAIRVFRYLAILLMGLFGGLGLLVGLLKLSNPALQMHSQTPSGQMIEQPLPSVFVLLAVGAIGIAISFLLARYWRPRTVNLQSFYDSTIE